MDLTSLDHDFLHSVPVCHPQPSDSVAVTIRVETKPCTPNPQTPNTSQTLTPPKSEHCVEGEFERRLAVVLRKGLRRVVPPELLQGLGKQDGP